MPAVTIVTIEIVYRTFTLKESLRMNTTLSRTIVVYVILVGLRGWAEEARQADEPKPDKDGFYSLFDGKSLAGWKVGKNADSWSVQDGMIVVNGAGPAHLFYEGPVHNHDFKNFHLKAQVMTLPNSNSGIYFH